MPSAPPRVIICTPSRGLIHSRTVETTLAALDAAQGHCKALGWLITHDLPIPACHETLAQRGLATGADFLWYVEEDMLPPPESLTALLARAHETGAGIVTLDYPVGEQPQSVITHHTDGSVWWCGLGCTLIAREVFIGLQRPWFDTSRLYLFTKPGVLTADETQAYRYGGQDVSFCLAARAVGVRIAVVPDLTAGHARLCALGAAGVNDGAHTIDVRY